MREIGIADSIRITVALVRAYRNNDQEAYDLLADGIHEGMLIGGFGYLCCEAVDRLGEEWLNEFLIAADGLDILAGEIERREADE